MPSFSRVERLIPKVDINHRYGQRPPSESVLESMSRNTLASNGREGGFPERIAFISIAGDLPRRSHLYQAYRTMILSMKTIRRDIHLEPAHELRQRSPGMAHSVVHPRQKSSRHLRGGEDSGRLPRVPRRHHGSRHRCVFCRACTYPQSLNVVGFRSAYSTMSCASTFEQDVVYRGSDVFLNAVDDLENYGL